MTGLVKMHLLRMFRQKGFYITAAIYLLVVFAFKKTMSFIGGDDESFISVFCFTTNLYPMFAALAPVFLYNKDISSGFIKNYGGALPKREDIAIERVIFTAIENGIFLLVASVGTLIISDFNIRINLHLFGFIGIMYISGVAMTLLCLLFVEITRNNAASVVATILVGIGLVNTILSTLASLVFKGFNLSAYTLSGAISALDEHFDSRIALKLLAIAACYIVISIAGNIISTHKRDGLVA